MSELKSRSSPHDIAEFDYLIDAESVEKKALLPSTILRDQKFFEALEKYIGRRVDPRFFQYIRSDYASDDVWKNIHGYRHPNRIQLLNAVFLFADMYYNASFLRPEWLNTGLNTGFKPIK
jgi:hypothetical protein